MCLLSNTRLLLTNGATLADNETYTSATAFAVKCAKTEDPAANIVVVDNQDQRLIHNINNYADLLEKRGVARLRQPAEEAAEEQPAE